MKVAHLPGNDDPTITPLCPVIDSVIETNRDDCGGTNGSIVINASGAHLAYSIDGGATFSPNNVFFGLSAGIYNIVVMSEDSECAVSGGVVVLVDPELPVINHIKVTNPNDCDTDNGEIEIEASVGTGSLEYSIDGGLTWSNSNIFTGLAAGSYSIAVRVVGTTCETTGPSIHLDGPTAPTIDYVSSSDPSGCGIENGTISIFATGDGTALQYSIDGGLNWSLNNTFTGLGEGMYSILVRYFNGTCESDGVWIMLNGIDAPIITDVIATDILCDTGGTITVTAEGGESDRNYLYSIDGINFQSSNMFEDLSAGTYTVYVSNADGTCIVSWPTEIVVEDICITISGTVYYDFNSLLDTMVNGMGIIPPTINAVLVKILPGNVEQVVGVQALPTTGDPNVGEFEFDGMMEWNTT